jgi:hypothetical protein
VDLTYTVVDRAVEGTIAVEVVQGGFHGKITAFTASMQAYLCSMIAKGLMRRLLMIVEISAYATCRVCPCQGFAGNCCPDQ